MDYEPERMRRPEPERDGPRRDFNTYARNYGLGGAPNPVEDGVRLGYSVLDEQMREGQRLAERLSGARGGPAALDMGGFVQRALDIYRDLGGLALAAAEALARNPALGAGLARPAAAGQAQAPEGFAIDVQSARRVKVQLDWRGGERPAAVEAAPLHPAKAGAKPIDQARFDGATLVLKIDDDQPAGVYHGVVTDAASGEACGTLTVRIA